MAVFSELFVILCTTLGINYVTFGHIRNLKRPLYVKIGYWAISIFVVPLLMIQALNSLSEEYLGVKFDVRFCTLVAMCPEHGQQRAEPQTNLRAKPHFTETDLSGADIVQVCKLGLNGAYDSWSPVFEFQTYVAEAKRRLKSINDCRMVLGLPTLEVVALERQQLAEQSRLRGLDQFGLCYEAMDEAGADWDLSDRARQAVREAQARRYTREGCLQAMSRLAPPSIALQAPTGAPTPPVDVAPQPDTGPPAAAPEFPTGYVRNPGASFANLRENPGKSSRVVKKLSNGTEVVLLGTKPSPSTGHLYCRVLTRDGVAGYVDHELVDRTCVLNQAQTSYLMETERREKMEAFQIFRDIAVIGLGMALKR